MRTRLATGILAVALAAAARPALAQNTTKTTSRILYHDGFVMRGTSHVYFIWYGCWTCGTPGSGPDVQQIVAEFVAGFGGTPYARILTTYPDGSGGVASGGFVYSGDASDPTYSHGAILTEASADDIIQQAILSGLLPLDSYGIYILLPSADVQTPRLSPEGVCQYHAYTSLVGAQVMYGVIANPQRAPSACAPQLVQYSGSLFSPPNGNFAADGIVSALAHVLDGIVTNPAGGGWFDRYGLENSDKCQGTYGQTYTTAIGARANVAVSGRDFLIQQNWVNVGRGYCGLHP